MGSAYVPANPIIVEILLDDDGHPPCDPPDGCEVCCLFTHVPESGPARDAWWPRSGARRIHRCRAGRMRGA